MSKSTARQTRFADYLAGKDVVRGGTEPEAWWLPHRLILSYIQYWYTAPVEKEIPVITVEGSLKKSAPEVIIRVTEEYSPHKLLDFLTRSGLERSTVGIEPNTFLMAGDTMLIWYKQWVSPVRVEWWGDRIEAITVVDSELHPVVSLAQLISPQMKGTSDYYVGWGTTVQSEPRFVFVAGQDHKAEAQVKEVPEFIEYKGDLSLQQRAFLIQKIYELYHGTNDFALLISAADPAGIRKTYPLLKKMEFVSARTNRGWICPIQKQILLTDHELVGTVDIINTQQNWLRLHSRIKVHDFVVHRDHGIARYSGIKRMVPPNEVVEQVKKVSPDYKEGQPVDYLHLQYAGNDELFVPFWQSQKVARYVGSSDHKPVLTPLHSGQWQAITKRVKRAVERISQDLVRLYAMRQQIQVPALEVHWDEIEALMKSFRFQDTPDQAKTTREILMDLTRTRPMDRLLVGDVGFGKTELAVRAAFAVVRNNQQVAILAPTTILTQQHLAVFRERLSTYGFSITVLNRHVSGSEQRRIVQDIHDGKINIVIGTHRLLAKDIAFKDLGLLIIDEEQNFGVTQKEKLKGLRLGAHVLSMSATPIPRTLNFSILGVRDLSVIHSPPPNRKEVMIDVVPFDWEIVKRAVDKEIARNGQVLIVYNKVLQIAGFTAALAEKIGPNNPGLRIAFAHGQLPAERLTEIMQAYYRGEIDVLVASTIVQNGIDIPNVNTLVITRSERFGLAQMYQLKGRIGRSERQGYAYFLLGEGEGYRLTKKARRRIQAIEQITQLGSGFSIASQDMAIRGVGNLLGKEQHGNIDTVGFALYQQMLEEAVHAQLESQDVGNNIVIETANNNQPQQ